MTGVARVAAPTVLAAIAALWLGLRQRTAPPAVDSVDLAPGPALYLFVSPDGPDPTPELIREIGDAARQRGLSSVRVHILESDPTRAMATLATPGSRDWARYLRLLGILDPLLEGQGIAPADPNGARLAASFGVTALPAIVYLTRDGILHLRQGTAAGLRDILDCRRSP